MKIAIITSRYPEKNNPYNHMFVHMRCVEMIKQGETVEVFVPSNTSRQYVYESVTVNKMPSKEIIKKIQGADVLYLHLLNIYPFSKTDGRPIYKYIAKNNTSFAMYVHGSEVQKYFARKFDISFSFSGFLKWFKKDVLIIPKMKRFLKETNSRKNAIYVFPSKWMKEETESNLRGLIKNFKIIPNGIDTNLFSYHKVYENKTKLLTVRPLSSKKYAVDIAIEIMKYLPQHYTLKIFGKGSYQKKYERLIDENHLSNRVSIENRFIEREYLNQVFSEYGFFLSPTRMDAQGVSMCEAMASGLLTVSSNNTAIPEFITDTENGIVGNLPKEIAEKIIQACDDEEKFYKITKNGRLSMEKIDIKKTVEQEIKTLKALINSNLN